MSTDDLSAPGSSIYSSSTLYVGDGTWDSTRNSFLLPNLMGLNFATMQYNGMGNRFAGLTQYHSLILGHGVVAAIVFIFIVPAAIFTAKYGHWDRQNSYKLHIYLQILTVFLSTVVLILGWFAVGPERSLTNPHHGIGVALYVLILFQFIWGWLMSKIERRRKVIPVKIPLKVWLHKLIGRSIALLGFAQIALGLTLYGSPVALFVLYALAGFFLLFAYLALDYYYKGREDGPLPVPSRPGPGYHSEYDSYVTGTQMTADGRPPRRESHWARNALAAAGALGVYETWKHRRDRRRQERLDGRVSTVGGYDTPGRPRPHAEESMVTPVTPSRLPSDGRRPQALPAPAPYGSRPPPADRLSGESWENEKYDSPPRRHTWRDRILGAGAGIVAFEGARRLFSGRRHDKVEEEVYDERHRPHHGAVSQADVSQVEAGEAPFSPGDPRRRPAGALPAGSALAASTTTPNRPPPGSRINDEYTSEYDADSFLDDRPHTLRDSVAVFGAVGGFRNWMDQRRNRRQQARINQQDMTQTDSYANRTSGNYPRPADGRRPSITESNFTGATPDAHGGRPDVSHPPLPAAAGAIPLATAAGALGSVAGGSRHNVVNESRHTITGSGYSLPPPPAGPPPNASVNRIPPVPGSAFMPAGAVEPDPNRLLADNTAANQSSAFGRVGSGEAAAGGAAAGLAAGMLAGRAGRTQSESPSRYRPSRERINRTDALTESSTPPVGTTGSPPISLKVKMHNDSSGHVTLRRLNEEEAAAERAARRQDRRQRRRRGSSLSSGIEDEPAGQRYRRNGGVLHSASQPITNIPVPPPMSSAAGSARRDSELNLPPPPPPQQSPPVHSSPPYPASGSGMINPVGSPGYGTDAGTGTDVSAFADNRRRRRAERARQRQATGGPHVEFE